MEANAWVSDDMLRENLCMWGSGYELAVSGILCLQIASCM